jgi:hypothetical protein
MGHNMVMRVKRTAEIVLSNYECITGLCIFTYERRIVYTTDNLVLSEEDVNTIIRVWNGECQTFTIKYIPFMLALNDERGLVAVNPDGATSLIMGSGKGVWFVVVFAPMDQDKFGLMKECVQAAKNLEASVSIFDV